jgi:hypothetical protein
VPGPVGQLAWVLLGVLDHVLEGLRASRGVDDKATLNIGEPTDGGEGLERIIRRLAQRRQDRQRCRRRKQEGVAVGSRLGSGLGADHTRCTAAILDDELLAEGLRELVGPRTGNRIGRPTGGIGHNQLDWLVRPARDLGGGFGGETSCQRGAHQMHELATMHAILPEASFFFSMRDDVIDVKLLAERHLPRLAHIGQHDKQEQQGRNHQEAER